MLTLLSCGFTSNELYRRVCRSVAAGERVILLVPEQETLHTEARTSALLPPSASLCFEVSNFSRLANTVFRSLGGLSYRYADRTVETLFMWRTLDALAPTLSFGAHRLDPSTVAEYCAAANEMAAAGISSEDLEAAAKQLPSDGHLAERLRELSMILSVYRASLSERYGSVFSDLDRLCEVLSDEPFFKDTVFYIDLFSSFTAQEYRILEALLGTSEVTVALTLPEPGAPRATCYEETEDTRRRLLAIAERVGTRIEAHEEVEAELPPALLHAKRELFRADRRLFPFKQATNDAIRTVTARDPYDGCDFIAADICRRVAEGARYRDFAVFVRQTDTYAGILDSALAAYGVPTFMSVHTDIRTFSLIKMIESLYAAVLHGFRREDVITYMKCGFAGISAEDADRFEIYTDFWRISGRAFTDGEAWSMNPDGYTDRVSEHGAEGLAAVNRVKAHLIPPMLAFGKEASACRTVKEHATVLYGFLRRIKAEEELVRRAAREERAAAERLLHLSPAVCDALDRLCEILGEEVLSTERFAELLSATFGAMDIGQIPTSLDEVTVGTAEMLRAPHAKYVYLLGACEGEFPSEVRTNGIFGEEERRVLSSLGLSVAPDPILRAARENFCFLRALCAGSLGATLISFETDAAGAVTAPSLPVKRLDEMFAEHGIHFSTADVPLSDRIFHPHAAAEHLGEYLGTVEGEALVRLLAEGGEYTNALRVTEGRISDTDCRLSQELAALLFPARLNLTQSRIDAYADCPFSYFCRHVLRLSYRTEASFDAMGIGTLIHAILENTFLALNEKSCDIKSVSHKELHQTVEEVCRKEVKRLCPPEAASNARLEHLFLRLRRTAGLLAEELFEEFAQSRFDPTFFELEIGRNGSPDPIVFESEEGVRMTMYGTIDRVDVYRAENGKVYLRVVDYKTGTKDFSADDIAKGRNLQLLLYLLSLWKTKNAAFLEKLGVKDPDDLLPGGMLYMSASPKDVRLSAPTDAQSILREARANLKRQGLVLEDEEVARAMDATLSGKYIPFKSKGGVFAPHESFASLARMGELLGDMEGAILRIGNGMCKGVADAAPASPKETHGRIVCETCTYRPICRKKGMPK